MDELFFRMVTLFLVCCVTKRLKLHASSECFKIYNGVRQGGLLSPFLFRFYIRDLIDEVTKLDIGCNYFGTNINLLAYADDMILLAPSWHGLQNLLNTIENAANNVKMSFNTKKRFA
jgi:Reverse transcriptase (RNA-dependent DNA polymerase)